MKRHRRKRFDLQKPIWKRLKEKVYHWLAVGVQLINFVVVERRRLENVEDSALTDVIAKRLKEDHLKQTGRLKTQVADRYTEADVDNMVILRCKNHRDSITCICISSDDKYVYSGSKDATVVKCTVMRCNI